MNMVTLRGKTNNLPPLGNTKKKQKSFIKQMALKLTTTLKLHHPLDGLIGLKIHQKLVLRLQAVLKHRNQIKR